MDQFVQNTFAFGREIEEDFPFVLLRTLPAHIPATLQTVHEFDGAVVLDQHAIGEVPNPWTAAVWNSFYCKHEEVLLALKAGGMDGKFAKVQILADLIAKLSQRLIIRQSKSRHRQIISYDDSNYILYRFTIYL